MVKAIGLRIGTSCVYRRYTNFSMEAIEQTFNGTADFGRKVTCTISRNGDLIHRMYLQVTLPAVSGFAFRWVDWVGHALINSVEMEIGGQRIDKHYGDWLHIWNELTQTAGHKDGYEAMVGMTSALTAPASNAAGTPETVLYIPLEFWFCRNPGLALPLIALQYHEVKVNIEFADRSKVCVCPGANLNSVPALKTGSLWVDYIYLDTDERRRFAQVSHEYLIEQLQYTGAESVSVTSNKLKLNFNHPVKELVWVVQSDGNVSTNSSVAALYPQAGASTLQKPANAGIYTGPQWFNYTDAPLKGEDPTNMSAPGNNCVDKALLQLNGHDRFAQREGKYFNLVQPYQHHENVPVTAGSAGINVYSFGLKPEEHQPSGTCNMSRIDTATLQLNLTSNATKGADSSFSSAQVRIYACSYNVLRIMSGIKVFRIAKQTCAKQSAANSGYCNTRLDKQWKCNLVNRQVYNWLVSLTKTCNKIKLSGNPFRALTTTPAWKHAVGTLGNDHGHSNNVKDWVIRSQAPAVRSVSDRAKVQRIDGFGGERNAILCDPLRYIPASCESMRKRPGWSRV